MHLTLPAGSMSFTFIHVAAKGGPQWARFTATEKRRGKSDRRCRKSDRVCLTNKRPGSNVAEAAGASPALHGRRRVL